MSAYEKRMPLGIPGAVSRGTGQATIEQAVFDKTKTYAFGMAVKQSGDQVLPLTAASDAVAGILVRPFPTQGADASGNGVDMTQAANIMKRGYICVAVKAGTPANGGQVYIDATDFSITAASSSNTALTGATFTGAAIDGVAEIRYNI